MRVRHIAFLSLLAAASLAVLVVGCSENNDAPLTPRSPLYTPKAAIEDTCSTASCIADFLNNKCKNLRIMNSGSPYTLSGHYIADACSPTNVIRLWGEDGTKPELRFPSQQSYGTTQKHASLHLVENNGNPDVLQDLVIKTLGYMDGNGNVAAIQYEATDLEWNNVCFEDYGSPTTVHFLGVMDFAIDDITQSSYHELVIGDEDWCGESGCGGPGDIIYSHGSSITNSELNGKIIIDVSALNASTLTISGNDPLNYLSANVDQLGSGDVEIDLEDNVLKDGAGASIIIKGDYTVNATANVTTKGPCEDDALEDFDTSGASAGASALNMISWRYDGVTYTSDPSITISNINVSTDPFACTKTITWTTNFPSSSKVYYGTKCNILNNTATGGGNTTSHTVVVPLTGFPVGNFKFKVESENTCDTALSSCQDDYRYPCINE